MGVDSKHPLGPAGPGQEEGRNGATLGTGEQWSTDWTLDSKPILWHALTVGEGHSSTSLPWALGKPVLLLLASV